MKKIVLGCAAVLLSLGLLAGCNNDAPIEDAVIINVESEATVIVGESLELPYTVSPEKADVVAASDNESIVTAEAQDGTLYLQGVAEGSAVVTLVGTYKKYAEANKNITVKVITEAEAEQEPGPGVPDEGTVIKTGKLGFYNEALYSYYYFDGTTTTSANREWGATTTTWEDAIDVTLTQYDEGETLSWVTDGATYYLGGTYSSSVGFEVTTTLAYINYNETYDSIETVAEDYFLGTYDEYTTIGWCVTSYYDQDYVAHVFTSEPEGMATPTSITISGENEVAVYERITLTAAIEPENADPRLTWSWTSEDSGEVTVSSTGVVLGVTAGSVTVTATSVADEAVSGSIDITVTEATGDAPTTYKLGSLDESNYVYRWFTGSASGNFLASSTSWNEGVDVYITAVDDAIDNSCTLSFYNDDGELKYISWSSSTSVDIKDDPYTWVWVESIGCFAQGSTSGRVLVQYTDGTFRAYAQNDDNLKYPHLTPYTEKPEDPEIPTPTVELEQVTSLTSGNTYYLGELDGEQYHLFTGAMSGYYLATNIDFNKAAPITITGSDTDGWTLTLESGSVIYGYVSGSYADFGIGSSEDVSTASGVSTFAWNTTLHTFTSNELSYTYNGTTYNDVYFEYRNSTVQLYGSNNLSNVSNAAHLYQVVGD